MRAPGNGGISGLFADWPDYSGILAVFLTAFGLDVPPGCGVATLAPAYSPRLQTNFTGFQTNLTVAYGGAMH
jgi:hypothetical protein